MHDAHSRTLQDTMSSTARASSVPDMGHGGAEAHRCTLLPLDNVFLALFIDSIELVLPLAKRDVRVHHHPSTRVQYILRRSLAQMII